MTILAFYSALHRSNDNDDTFSSRLLSGTLAALLLASGALIPSAVPSAMAVEQDPNGPVNEPYPKVPVGVPLVGHHYTAHRSYLRPGCRWDVFGRGLQHCQVYSQAMKRSHPRGDSAR